jgi:hypothetical protein
VEVAVQSLAGISERALYHVVILPKVAADLRAAA